MGLQKVQGAETKVAKPGLNPARFTPGLSFNDPVQAIRRVNTADPHTEMLEVAEHKANSRYVRTSLPHNEIGSGRRGRIPK